jgi:hypothetical protein
MSPTRHARHLYTILVDEKRRASLGRVLDAMSVKDRSRRSLRGIPEHPYYNRLMAGAWSFPYALHGFMYREYSIVPALSDVYVCTSSKRSMTSFRPEERKLTRSASFIYCEVPCHGKLDLPADRTHAWNTEFIYYSTWRIDSPLRDSQLCLAGGNGKGA